ncbi:hypothetical protein GCM10009678_11130 [Actinomadura kijaniata]|uniref:8-oxo-dGTP pyrophosphatase MutT (NUDIX family) n=1 Tax=Actinomadura namibiensis TaxID=182080 RepID=A0A7W3LN76_ACTNM|nr:NUDIX domain-containing protein [Actinomadura namibiensis]MBA8951241.1 8-oxo-dGTP pyrophosphatase MutT (NUDIX family) [Actinomadura namibiensis]
MTEAESDRPAVRIVCLDGAARVLLLNWRDPVHGRVFWEPPGGGVDAGESALEAARRELTEETGLPGSAVRDVSVPVERDFTWMGRRYVKTEPFFLARFAGTPEVDPAGFTAEEHETYVGHGWFSLDELAALEELDPPHMAEIIGTLLAR